VHEPTVSASMINLDWPHGQTGQLESDFRHQGIRVDRPRTGGDLARFIVVLLRELGDSTYSVIRGFTTNERHRVLLILDNPQAYSGRQMWELLGTNTAEILPWQMGSQEVVSIASKQIKRWAVVEDLLSSSSVTGSLIGGSTAWRRTLRGIVEAAKFTDASLLLTGPSGTGKELVARMVHDIDPREEKGDLVVVDCATIVPELSGSEFFGHERGAFTNAMASRDGAFALADGGTLFLDEIGELPIKLQAELLRVIQEGAYKRVGSNVWRRSNFRLISATHKDLGRAIRKGTFRSDLFHRLATFTFALPPLEERRDDIPLLVSHFLAEIVGTSPPLEEPVREFLAARDYPGNIRELRQVVARIASRYVGSGPITVGSLPREDLGSRRAWPGRHFERAIRRALSRGKGLEEIRSAAAEVAYRIVLGDEKFDTTRSATRLKVTKRAVQAHLKNAGGNGRDLAGGSLEDPDGTRERET
jgi:transcriptional regulator with GAF, ATPase, and Fis domain